MGQEPESAAAIRLNQAEQGRTFLVKLPCTVGFEAKQLVNAQGRFVVAKIFRRNTVSRKVFFGEIHAAELVVLMDVTDDVRELEGQAESLGKVQSARVGETEHVRAGQADGSGD